MASEIGVAYLSIVPETSKIAPGVRQAMGGVEKEMGRSGEKSGSRLSAGIQKTLKRTAVGVGVAGGAAIATGLTKGLGRLNGIEQAESKLRGLGHSATGVGDIMEDALASVRGTAFGLEDAATIAASAVAAGIPPGEALQRTLKLTGDAATIAGTDLASMGSIINKVATSDMMQMDVANQLMDAGIPILQLLGDQMGVTADEARAMASAGEISFAQFQDALEAGMGGAALEAGNTVQGAFANMGAAAGRLGATIAGPFFRQAAGGFGGVTDALDAMNDRVGPVMADVEQWLTGTAVPAFNEFREAGQRSWEAFANSADARRIMSETVAMLQQMGQLAVGVGSGMGRIAVEVSKAAAALGVSTWDVFVTLLNSTATILNATLVPALDAVATLAENNSGAVTAMVAAWMAFKTVPALMAPVRSGLDAVRTAAIASGTAMQTRWFEALRQGAPVVTQMQNAMIGARTQIGALGAAARVGVTNIGAFGGVIRTGATTALNGMRTAASNAMSVLGGPWGLAMIAAGAAVSGMIEQNRRYEAAMDATSDMQLAVAGSARTMFESLLDGASTLDAAETATREFTASMEEIGNNGPNWLGRARAAIGEVEHSLVGLQSETQKQSIEHRDLADTAAEATDVMSDLGLETRDIAAAAVGSESAYQRLRAELLENGRGGEYLADQMAGLREGFLSAEDAANRLGPAGMIAADALQAVSEQAGEAEDRAHALNRAFMELAGVELTAQEATGELTRTLEQVGGKMDEVAGATLDVNGALDMTAPAGVAAHDALMGLQKAMTDSVAAGNDVNQVFGQSQGQLDALQSSLGLTDAEFQNLLESYRLTPDQIQTTVTASGDEALATVEVLRSVFSDFEGEPMTKTVTVHDEEFLHRLEGMGFAWDNFDENTGAVDITVEDEEALAVLDRWVMMELPKIDGANPTAVANLDAQQVFDNVAFAEYQLGFLDLQRPTPIADMDISRLTADQQQAMQEVGLLDGQKPTPDAFMNIDQLTAEQQAALALTFNLDAERPTPISDMTNDQLNAAADRAHARLDSVDENNPRPEVRAETQDAMTKLGNVWNRLSGLIGGVFTVRANVTGSANRAGSVTANRAGSVTAFAGGSERHVAQIAAPGEMRLWAEPETGGEAYIPLAPGKRSRSEAILADVAGRFGLHLLRQDMSPVSTRTPGGTGHNGDTSTFTAFEDGGLSGVGVRSAMDYLRFAQGENVGGYQMERSLDGAPYENFPGRDGAWGDCSYTQGRLAAFGLGLNPLGARQFSTHTQQQWLQANGANMGRGPAGSFRMGWNHSVHTSGTLPDGTNVEMGGSAGGGKIGAGAAGWDSPSYTMFAWIPANESDLVRNAEDLEWAHSGPGGSGTSVAGSEYDPDSVELSREGQAAAEVVTEAQNDPESPFYDTGANTWGELAGNIVGGALAEQINLALGVFDIPTTLPPLVQAGRTWRAQREEGQTDAEVEQNVIDAADAIEAAEAAGLEADAVDGDDPIDVEVLPDWGEPFFVREITRAAREAGLNREAAVIGTGTSIVEVGSPLRMLANNAVPESLNFRHDGLGSDHDSVGLFQQRDNGAWGTVAQRMNAFDSAGMFFAELSKLDWENMGRGVAAQRVQRSAFPDRYEPVMGDAEDLVDQHGVFDRGGSARGKGMLHKDVIDPERVLSPDQTRAFEDLVFNQLPDLSGLASSITSGAVNAGAGMAATAANTVVPGSGAIISGAAGPAGELAGMYAGQVTSGLQESVTEFGRDMMSIPRSMMDSTLSVFDGLPEIPTIPQLSTLAPEVPAPEPAMVGAGGGGGDINFNGYDEDWAWSKFRRLESEKLGGRGGARG